MKVREGNIVQEVTRGVILQQVNAQGVMRSGVAKDIREKWPNVFEEYHDKILGPLDGAQGRSYMGQIVPVKVDEELWVINLVGQQFYGRDGKRYTSYDALDDALAKTADWILGNAFTLDDRWYTEKARVHFPLLGSGLGGGHWQVVKSLIDHRLDGFDCTLWVLPGTTVPADS